MSEETQHIEYDRTLRFTESEFSGAHVRVECSRCQRVFYEEIRDHAQIDPARARSGARDRTAKAAREHVCTPREPRGVAVMD